MRPQRAAAVLLLGLLAAALAYGAVTLPVLRRLTEPVELSTLDWRMRSAADGSSARSPVVLVFLDSAAVASWPYEVPYPRTILADLVDIVAAAGPLAISLDVLLDRRYPVLEALEGGDSRLRESIARAGNVFLVSRTVERAGARHLLEPDRFFSEVAAGVGLADLPTPYETVREAVLAARTTEGTVGGLPLALYARARGASLDALVDSIAATRRFARGGSGPGGPEVWTVPLHFVGPPSRAGIEGGAFSSYSASVLLELRGLVPKEFFRDQIVLIGTGYHAEDRFRSPFYEAPDADGGLAGWTYGSEILATATHNLLTATAPRALSSRSVLILLFAGAAGVAAAVLGFGVVPGAMVGLFSWVALAVAAWYLYDAWQLHVPLVAPGIVIVSALLLSSGYLTRVEGAERRRIRAIFSHYLSRDLVDELVRDPTRLRLGGEKRHMTILFADLAGFTGLSETTAPERLVELLNQYLGEMTAIIIAEGGMLDKFMGDGIMALFGAPAELPDHAARACRAALRMHTRLEELNAGWSAEGWPPLSMRVGISSGTPIVGNIGGADRFDYTALGDAVNLASRLEAVCKHYGIGTLISESTWSQLDEGVEVREIDLLTVYGKTRSTRVFEINRAGAWDPAFLSAFSDGIEAFRSRAFREAEASFARAFRILPDDGPCLLYLERCQSYLVTPPPAEWDSCERMIAK
jgi:adenylate cyclase